MTAINIFFNWSTVDDHTEFEEAREFISLNWGCLQSLFIATNSDNSEQAEDKTNDQTETVSDSDIDDNDEQTHKLTCIRDFN